jgi:hypothetical protein
VYAKKSIKNWAHRVLGWRCLKHLFRVRSVFVGLSVGFAPLDRHHIRPSTAF